MILRIKLFLLSSCILLYCFSANAQLAKISFTLNNFVHQKPDFTFLNEIDTQGGFSEPINTFGQFYYLSKESLLPKKLRLQYGLGLGYTRVGFRFYRSEDFLSVGSNNVFVEKRTSATEILVIAPIKLLYPIYESENSAFYLNINFKTIFAIRSRILFSSGTINNNTRTVIHEASFRLNDEDSPDFTLGAGIDYRRRIGESLYWWKLELNYNYGLTTLYTGEATLFGNVENLNIEIKNKFTHTGLAIGILKSL